MISKLRLTLAVTLLVTGCNHTFAQENSGEDVLERFVGIWKLDGEALPSKWTPEGKAISGHENAIWALKKRVILIRAVDQIDNRKSLFISTFDPANNVYPMWGFDSQSLMGVEWELAWDADSKATVGHATDLPTGWTSNAVNQFPDADTNNAAGWIKDDVGEVLLNQKFIKKRLPEEDGPEIAAAWSKIEEPDNLPAELKVLDRMIGDWDAVSTMKPAEWTPEGGRSTMIIKREWILNGRFVMDTPIHSNGQEGMTIIGFDPNQKVYQGWRFNSEGEFPRSPFKGSWNAKSQTLSYVGKLEDGKTNRSSVRFANRNQEVWEIKVTDADGKVYLDMDTVATRRAAAGDKQPSPNANQPKPTDQSRLQGTWGATQYVQNGQGEDEAPIAPEDSAIKFVFKGDRFTLLASGNAGRTPVGSYKLGSSGTAKTIDLIFPPEPNRAKGQTMSGIYEFEGETLKITYATNGARRPNDFKSAGGSKHVAIVFKRIED